MDDSVWTVQCSEGTDYLQAIATFLLSEFSRLFGLEIVCAEKCVIYNDASADTPMLVTNSSPISIRLAQPSLNYWSQTVFQLSHELCHYVIRQKKQDKSVTLGWFEEIVCEAFSLYALEYASKRWELCALCESNPSYAASLTAYLKDELRKSGTDVFASCTTLKMLTEYERTQIYHRETHRNERNLVYREMRENPKEIQCICRYQEYLCENKLTIDFLKWIEQTPFHILSVLYTIQPVKEQPND